MATPLELEEQPLRIQSPFQMVLTFDSSLGVQCVSCKQIMAALVFFENNQLHPSVYFYFVDLDSLLTTLLAPHQWSFNIA